MQPDSAYEELVKKMEPGSPGVRMRGNAPKVKVEVWAG